MHGVELLPSLHAKAVEKRSEALAMRFNITHRLELRTPLAGLALSMLFIAVGRILTT